VDPRTVTCVEAHGTGTELGDPIELEGLTRAFGSAGPPGWCSVGSLKSNLGHLEAAAGLAGLAKLVLQFRHGMLAPTLHAAPPNPHLRLAGSAFRLQLAAEPWARPVVDGVTHPRRAGLSSFGAGGANAHVILEEPPPRAAAPAPGPRAPRVLVLSARSAGALRANAGRLATWLRAHIECSLADLAFTLRTAREAMPERLAWVAADPAEAAARLEAWLGGDAAAVHRGRAGPAPAPPVDGALESLAAAWVAGAALEEPTGAESAARVLPLPPYAFEVRRHVYPDLPSAAQVPAAAPAARPVAAAPDGGQTSWRVPGTVFRAHSEVGLELLPGGIALVRMRDRAHRNMFTPALLEGLMHVFARLEDDPAVKVAVITGDDGVFAMGGTRDELLELSDQIRSFASLEFIFKGFLQCPVPVIAAIQGHAQGGGLVFGLYADVVVMAEEALYSAVFTKYGFTPGLGATHILGEKLGADLAAEMMFTAGTYPGAELNRRGAGVRFRPAAEVLPAALEIAREMAEKPAHTLRTLKQGLARRQLARLPAVIADEVRMHGETFGHPEVKARIRHFIRGTEPDPVAPPPPAALPSPATVPAATAIPAAAIPVAAAPELAAITRALRDNLCEKLRLDPAALDGNTTFRDLGLDSILGVEFIHRVNRDFGSRRTSVPSSPPPRLPRPRSPRPRSPLPFRPCPSPRPPPRPCASGRPRRRRAFLRCPRPPARVRPCASPRCAPPPWPVPRRRPPPRSSRPRRTRRAPWR
jgi:enoyl-CoA hydratase/carnithine racemase